MSNLKAIKSQIEELVPSSGILSIEEAESEARKHSATLLEIILRVAREKELSDEDFGSLLEAVINLLILSWTYPEHIKFRDAIRATVDQALHHVTVSDLIGILHAVRARIKTLTNDDVNDIINNVTVRIDPTRIKVKPKLQARTLLFIMSVIVQVVKAFRPISGWWYTLLVAIGRLIQTIRS